MKFPFYLTFFVTIFLIGGCTKKPNNDKLGPLDLSRPAVIGGSFLAGYQDGAICAEGQQHSIPYLFYEMTSNYGGNKLNIPLLGSNEGIGINLKPWETLFQSKSSLGDRTDCNGVVSLGPVKTLYQETWFNDFENISTDGLYQCYPYMTTNDMWDVNFGDLNETNPFYRRIASNPGFSSAAQDLIDAKPTFVTIWLGTEDIYNFAMSGGYESSITPTSVFRTNLTKLLDSLQAIGTKGVIATIPSIDHFPFFNLIPYNGANVSQADADELNGLYQLSGMNHIEFNEGANGFITYDDSAPNGIRQMVQNERLLLTAPLDSMKCYLYGLLVEYVADRYVLDLDEISEIHAATISYNNVMKELADIYDFALFDSDSFFDNVQSGIQWNGVDIDLEFVSGGFLSLDGINPHQKGHELLTNEIIKSVNNYYYSKIPTINCFDCDGVLFP